MARKPRQPKRRADPQIAKRIEFYVDQSDMTTNEIAAKLGVVPSAVSNWANGHTSAKTSNLMKLAEVLGIDVRKFFAPLPRRPRADDSAEAV